MKKFAFKRYNYDVAYSTVNNLPVWGYYRLGKKNFGSHDRPNTFQSDPQIPESKVGRSFYKKGYHRGHMMPAADNTGDPVGMKESFYYTNVAAQTPELNTGPWKTLETKERNLARQGNKLTIMFGNYGVRDYIGKDNVVVPENCWKIIIAANLIKHTADTLAYLFDNENDVENDIENYKIPYKDLEKSVGIEIKDMEALHNIKDTQAQIDYMVQRMENRLNNDLMTKEEMQKIVESRYKDPNTFVKEFGVKDVTPLDYFNKAYDDSQTKFNASKTEFFEKINENKSSFDFILNSFSGIWCW